MQLFHMLYAWESSGYYSSSSFHDFLVKFAKLLNKNAESEFSFIRRAISSLPILTSILSSLFCFDKSFIQYQNYQKASKSHFLLRSKIILHCGRQVQMTNMALGLYFILCTFKYQMCIDVNQNILRKLGTHTNIIKNIKYGS